MYVYITLKLCPVYIYIYAYVCICVYARLQEQVPFHRYYSYLLSHAQSLCLHSPNNPNNPLNPPRRHHRRGSTGSFKTTFSSSNPATNPLFQSSSSGPPGARVHKAKDTRGRGVTQGVTQGFKQRLFRRLSLGSSSSSSSVAAQLAKHLDSTPNGTETERDLTDVFSGIGEYEGISGLINPPIHTQTYNVMLSFIL